MTRLGVVIAILLLIMVPVVSSAVEPTVEVIAFDGTNLTFKISHDLGIWSVLFNYEDLGPEPGFPASVNRRHYVHDCPQTVEITVPKEMVIDETNAIGVLKHILVEDCRPQLHGSKFCHKYIFKVFPEDLFDVDPNPTVGSGIQSEPPAPAPDAVPFFEWRFWGLALWTIITIYLLWWRLFGPFRA